MGRIFHYEEYQVIRFFMAYLVTGIALVGYDFQTPPIHKKAYILNKSVAIVIVNWFLWPIFSVKDAWVEQLLRYRGIRYIVGVILLFISLFIASGLSLQFFVSLTRSALLSILLSFLVTLVLSAFSMAITMPGWD